MKRFQLVISKITGIMEYICCVILCVCTMAAVIGVVARYFLDAPLRWVEEVSALTLVWMVYLSQSKLEHDNNQLTMTVVYQMMGKRLQKAVRLLRSIITIPLCGYLFYAAYNIVQRNYEMNTITPALGLPWWIVYLVMPVGFAFVILVHLNKLLIGLTSKEDDQCFGA